MSDQFNTWLRTTLIFLCLGLLAQSHASENGSEQKRLLKAPSPGPRPDTPLESSKRPAPSEFFRLQLRGLDGKQVSMQEFQGKLLLIVNTASSCGFTPQMKDLVELQKKYGKRGLQVLGFPSNDFRQESGSAQEIQTYAEKEFQLNFPLFEKASVKGPQAQPLFRYLTEQANSFPKDVLWNFEKFLVSPSGQVLARYRSAFSPSNQELQTKIEEFLPKKL